MAKQYYTLVAGLREYSLDAENKGFDAPAVIEEVRSELRGNDRKYLSLFYNYYDIANIISIMAGRENFSELGNYSRETLEQEVKNPQKLPTFIRTILRAYAKPDNPEYDDTDKSKAVEKALFTAYYDKCSRSRCRFIRQWYEFDRNLRNVSAALTARRLGIPVADELVGGGYVTETMSRSSAADFGLKGELEYIDRVISAAGEEGDLLGKEHAIDLVRWEMADQLTTFDYFNINTVLAYLAKVNLVHRWASLDPKAGREMFRRLMESLGAEELVDRAQAESQKK